MAQEIIRESVIAGSWYPDHPETLRREIRKHLEQAQSYSLNGELFGLIAPHAGYRYSGGVAAHAYRLLESQPFDRVLIVAPSHRAHFPGAGIYHLGGFQTPLGVVPLDRDLVDKLLQYEDVVRYVPQAHAQEHSLEIQLPFLQTVLNELRLTPLVMGDQSFESCRRLAGAIADVCEGKRVLLVASTDLSHYHPYHRAKQLDQVVLDRLNEFDPQGLSRDIEEGNCEACGGGPMVTVMLAARRLGANKAKVLHYANSGDVTGDNREVVGYVSAALYNNPGGAGGRREKGKRCVGVDLGLSSDEKETLRDLAYQAIKCRCFGGAMPENPVVSPGLEQPRGAFVCIKKGGDLRGCIGTFEGGGPLYQTIRNMAVQAAFADPRFCALDPSELDDIDIEISVLTPLEAMGDPQEITIGKHGLYIKRSNQAGLLLPQVATENGWDRMQFLEWTCRKAGLPPDAWKQAGTEIYLFSADVF